MTKILFLGMALFLMAGTALAETPTTGQKKEGISQAECAKRIVTTLGWGDGLPQKAQIADYLSVLAGKRSFRFEAEDYFDKRRDSVTVRNSPVYGPFSGKGWLSGISSQTAVHFKVFIPLAGDYQLKVAAKGDGQLWSIAGRAYKVNTGKQMVEAIAGKLSLEAGIQEFNVILPPEGAIDYLVFEATPLAEVAPLNGWRPAAPLAISDLAEIEAALFGLEAKLPDDPASTRRISVAETGIKPEGVRTTTDDIFGQFYGKTWLRVGILPVVLDIPLTIESTAFYKVKVLVKAEKLTATFAGRRIERTGPDYLAWTELLQDRLTAGSQTLRLELPPAGGVDVVELTRKRSTPADYLALTGITGDPTDPVTTEEFDATLASWKERAPVRR